MSMVVARVSVAASRKWTLWAVLAVTIRLGPPGRLLRSIKLLHLHRKQFFRRHRARRQALLVHEAADRLPGGPVGLDAIGPEILAEDAPILLDVIDQPRQRDAQRVSVVEPVDRDRLGVAERLVDAPCDPGMLAMYVLAYHHGMHDREDLGAPVVMSLDRLEVREQTRDRGRAVEE